MPTKIFNDGSFKRISPCFGIALLNRLTIIGKDIFWMLSNPPLQYSNGLIIQGAEIAFLVFASSGCTQACRLCKSTSSHCNPVTLAALNPVAKLNAAISRKCGGNSFNKRDACVTVIQRIRLFSMPHRDRRNSIKRLPFYLGFCYVSQIFQSLPDNLSLKIFTASLNKLAS